MYRFGQDTQALSKIKNGIFLNGGHQFLKEYQNTNPFVNPLVKIYFHYYKKKFTKRFVDQAEGFESETSNVVLSEIIRIYRNYWVQDFMKSEGDTSNYNQRFVKAMGSFLVDNGKSSIHKDSMLTFSDIRSDLVQAIEEEGAFAETFFLNDKYDIIIWTSQYTEMYQVETPYETREVPVVFFSDRILDNRQSFLSFGDNMTGGWPNNKKGVIFSGDYDVESEMFRYSLLTHEANHFFDVEKYPNLSPADLEYRSKLIELIYVKKDKDRMLRQFLFGASDENRNHGHAYANFKIIYDLSALIFSNSFEGDYNKWKDTPVEIINKRAMELFEINQKKLEANPEASEVI